MLALFILVPFVTDFINFDIRSPNSDVFGFLDSFQNIFGLSITNIADSNKSVGIFAIFTAIVGGYFVKEDKVKEKVVYGMGIFFLLCTSTIMPWGLFNNTIIGKALGVIQFPYRLNTYVGFFLMVTFSLIVSKFIHSIANKKTKMLVGTGIIVFFIISYYGSLTGLLVKVHTLQGNLLRNNVETAKVIPNDAIIRNSNYNNIFDYSILYGETDYYPKMAFDNLEDRNVSVEINPKINSILLHKVIMGNKGKIETPKVTANRIEYSVKVNKKEKIDVPVLAYKRTKVMLNGRNVRIKRNRCKMSFKKTS